MPTVVADLEDAIDAISGANSWVRGDEHTMDRLRKANWNFRSQAAGQGLAQLISDCKIALAMDFIRAGAPIDFSDGGMLGGPPVAKAAFCGNLGLVRLLESRGLLSRKEDAVTFLRTSVRSGYPDLVAIALKQFPHAGSLDEDGFPLLATAAARDSNDWTKAAELSINTAKVISLLLAAGADPNARDRKGGTALHSASNAAAVHALVAGGADVKARDEEGRTPLFGQAFADATSALLKAGAEINAKDHSGMTPLESAVNEEVALLLLRAGAHLPTEPQHLQAMIERTTERQWTKLLPLIGKASAARQLKSGR